MTIRNPLPAEDLAAGENGENYFIDHSIDFLFFKMRSHDERALHGEGEYLLSTGELIEVKSDYRCFAEEKPTGRIPIEIHNPRNPGRKGWSRHCYEGGVTHLVFECYKSRAHAEPCFILLIPYDTLRAFMAEKFSEKDKKWWNSRLKRVGNGTENLCIPLKELLENVKGCRRLYPLPPEEVDYFFTYVQKAIEARKAQEGNS